MPKIDEIVAEEEASAPYDPAEVFSVPASLANKSYVTMTPMGVRLTFTEQYSGGHEHSRAAVFLNFIDAIAFKDLLEKQLAKITTVINELEEPAPAPAAREED